MRHRKSYISSLGLSGVMLALALVLLGLGGRVLGFSDWPAAIADRLAPVFLGDRAESPRPAPAGPGEVAADAAPAAVAVAAGPGGARRATSARSRRSEPNGSERSRRRASARRDRERAPARRERRPRSRQREPGADPVAPQATAPAPVGRAPVRSTSLKEDAAGATERLTSDVGSGVRPLSDPLGQTVSDTGKALSQIVRTLPLP